MEETGLSVKVRDSLGTFDFFVRYQENDFTHMHHIAALYTVDIMEPQHAATIGVFAEQDSLGMEWVDLAAITLDSASPYCRTCSGLAKRRQLVSRGWILWGMGDEKRLHVVQLHKCSFASRQYKQKKDARKAS